MAAQRMIVSAESLARRQAGMIGHAQARAEGVTVAQLRNLVRRGRWLRVTRGVYRTPVDTLLDSWDEVRQQAAWTGVLAVPGSTAVGMAALALQQVQGLPRRIRPEVGVSHGRSITGPAGVLVRRCRHPIPAVLINGFRVATVPVALAHALPEMSRRDAVAVLDSALHTGRLTSVGMRELERTLHGRRGAQRARELITLADGRAESPLETRARLLFVDAGLPPPDLQVRVHDRAGRVVARGDLGWQRSDGTWVIVEMDGRGVHGTPTAVYQDRSRQNRMVLSRQVTILRFTDQDLDDGSAVEMIGRALCHPARVA
ncbi:type IV toxin-antitoxin system AbiEi family antitoxin domain-containing protein [Ruania halotolerans]|uniref:type IV toxin-antitoxin system AbiEi family antitoxin domain-containing protein n=1 Tax=Ruania halotolerans TaxID=2897773 RepID=UPI001E3416F6|nr:type IV toxin-antitoxin system AbiEi family antitoxin domain-containing protein [Ruania halotolerans]UFU05395.1 type IV toxin-antitoxin system AbiEi family antitoxin domain-containing protein [Ruania halotolerans]